MKYLYDNGYKTLKLQDVADYYYKNNALSEKSVLLTFDDMYKSIYKYAYSILKKYEFNAVGFVVLDWLYDHEQEYSASASICMSKGELNKISDVFEFVNHTKSLHTRGSDHTLVQTIDKQSFVEDIKECEIYATAKGAFAYPFGAYNEDFKLLTSPGSGIDSFEKLDNKKISIIPNFVLEYIMDEMADKNCIKYQTVVIPAFQARFDALLSNQIDSVIFTEPQATMIVAKGAKLLASSKEYNIKAGTILFSDSVLQN